MAQITKTVIFPCSTEWLGQDQSPTTVGIATYEGPEQLLTEWLVGADPAQCERTVDPDSKDAEKPCPLDCVQVMLDCNKYPLHALALWGQKYPGARIIVDVGPSDVDNPSIADPHDFQETFDQRSFYYDTATSTWSNGAFNHDGDPTGISTEGVMFGWDWVRATRNQMLDECDGRVAAPDTPEPVIAPWKVYRQRLRDLPSDWAGIGTATHLIVWPMDPDQVAAGKTFGVIPAVGGDITGDLLPTDPNTDNAKLNNAPS